MKKLLLLIPFLVLAACNPGQKSTSATRSYVGAYNGLNTGLACANGSSNVGQIYDSGQGNFEANVKALLSATTATSDIGSISSVPNATTGVRFSGIIKLDTSGNVVAASSNLSMKIYDSLTLTGSDPIGIDFAISKGSQISGQFNMQTGQGQVTFSDNYGIIRFQGTISAQTFSGVVQFQNSTNVNGGSAASGTLGQFTVARCGIIQ